MITNPAEYKVGLYIRLSDEDDGIETQSESVVNQQKILNEFARRERLRVVDTYIDATDIIGLKQNPTNGRRFSPIFLCIGHFSE